MNILHDILGQTEPPESVIRRITKLLQPRFTDFFRVYYDPAFPRADRSTFSWFQVVFAVGPGEDVSVCTDVHRQFEQLLELLAGLPEVQRSEFSLRARLHVPPHSRPDHPHMFIECAWHGSDVAAMAHDRSFSSWYARCYTYTNRFNDSDPLNKQTCSS